ncbi:MAG: outer membrane protein transport protein [Shinella zoogloeoides]|uniref:OmpP1/FadL family transporter n=1 Tax=Shinella zoogloeoides TaxID=352475 RepID=UPI003C774AEC
MIGKIFKNGILSVAAFAAFATAAHAGGFSRGEADTDILFESGDFIFRSGATYISPRRKFATIAGAQGTDGVFTNDYWIPNIAAKIGVSENFACALTYTQPFGGDADYGKAARMAIVLANLANSTQNAPYGEKGFDTNEYGATCDVKFDAGAGKIHLLGGVFIQDFSYTAVNEADTLGLGIANYGTLHLEDDSAFGYRIGAAYEITEYALRVSLMYRSRVKHDADEGYYDYQDLGTNLLPASGYGTLPQSLKLSAQTGVAPGWLVYGSVKWTDWSVLDTLNYQIAGGPREDVYNWKDGWTIQAGVAHVFNEKLTGTLNLTWDSGVSTGADIYTDTWTLGAGVQAKVGPGDLRFGGAISYLTSGKQSLSNGATFDATTDNDWAYGITGSYKISF